MDTEDLTAPPPPLLNDVLCTIELMGRRIYIAFASEVFIAGSPFLRLDIPLPGGHSHAYFIGAQSIYGVSPMGADELTESARVANENTLAYAGLLSPAERARFDLHQAHERMIAALAALQAGRLETCEALLASAALLVADAVPAVQERLELEAA